MTSLKEITDRDFDVVVALDNALPHLSLEQLASAASAIRSVLKPGGLLMASIRDYDQILREKPTVQQPVFYSRDGSRRFVHQVWDWIDDTKYTLHLYITNANDKRLGVAPFCIGVSLYPSRTALYDSRPRGFYRC